MTTKSHKKFIAVAKQILPYVLSGAAIISLVFYGSEDQRRAETNSPIMLSVINDTSSVSMDQLSELNMVAQVASNNNLVSSEYLNADYVMAVTQYSINQTSNASNLEKKYITDTGLSRGIIVYSVSEGESMESIAAKYGLTTTQIRWSNGLKTTTISAGDTLYLPNTYGIVYTVKSGDTLESIVNKTGANYEATVQINDLELTSIYVGMRIVLPNGTLPNTERPEYVAPVYNYSSSSGSTSARLNAHVVAYGMWLSTPYASGQCTSYAWYMRQDLPGNLGNANTWASRAAAAGFPVDRNPRAGDIFQTSSGWYGHVGYVVAVNDDGSILVREMNYGYVAGRVLESTIPASSVKSFNYIHRK